MHITINTANDERELDIHADSGTVDDLIKLIHDEVTDIPSDWSSLMIIITNPKSV